MLAKKLFVTALFASSAAAMAFTAPVWAADKTDRAQEAIAAADAKVHTAESLGTGADAPRETADARAALAMAREDLKSHHRSAAIEEAIHASALADTAIGDLQRHQGQAAVAARESQRAAVAAAQDQAASAQQQAADANARADAAQLSAARSAEDAAAARDAAAHIAQTPAPQVETSVTTEQHSGTHHVTHTRVKRRTTTTTTAPPAPESSVTTTTTVTPQQPQP